METPAAKKPRASLIVHPPGARFGRLVVLRRDGRFLDCLCDCGADARARAVDIRRGRVVSCGCQRKENRESHGMSKTPDYDVWRGMIERCRNPASNLYPNYGGRGIKVCDEWAGGFEAFFADMGPRPFPRASLDRIDNDGHYEPGNVRWATYVDQANNRRGNVRLTMNGETLTISGWADRAGLKYGTVQSRLKHGSSIEEALRPVSPRPSAQAAS